MFLEKFAASGMYFDWQRAGELMTGQVSVVATLMRATEATARTYLDGETIKDIERRMLSGVVGERPGADPRCSRGLAGLVLPCISGVLG